MSIAVGAAPAEANPPWPQTTEMQVRVQENVPDYPFAGSHGGNATYLTARFVQRWLGIVGEDRAHQPPCPAAADQCNLLPSCLPDDSISIAQLPDVVNSPALGDRLPSSPASLASEPTLAGLRVGRGRVIPASADVAVDARISDRDEPSLPVTDQVDPIDLINSLTDTASAPTQPAVPRGGDQPTDFRLHDQETAQPSDLAQRPAHRPGASYRLADSATSPTGESRQPQVLKVKEGLSVRITEQLETATPGTPALSLAEPTAQALPVLIDHYPTEKSAAVGLDNHASSRRPHDAVAPSRQDPVEPAPVSHLPEPELLLPLPVESAPVQQTSKLAQLIQGKQSEPSQPPMAVPPELIVHDGIDKPIDIGLRDSTPLHSDQPIYGLSVEHAEICQAIQTGPRSYSLIGLREGTTRLAVITQASPQQAKIYHVQVNSTKNSGTRLDSLADSMSHTIQEMYPRSRVQLIVDGHQLIVSGETDSEESARRILGLVRKTTLSPVVDKLRIY